MAKKTLTPEQAEIKAMKKEKKSQNWTKFWAIVLAAVLTFAVVSMGKSQADDAIEAAKEAANNNAVVENNNAANNEDEGDLLGGNDASNNDASNNDSSNNDASNNDSSNNNSSDNSSSNNNASNNNANTNNGPSEAEVVKTFNDVTAAASKGSYNITRTGEFTKPIDVGSATDSLNDIIKGVDENADLNSVVGGFLGIKKDPITGVVTNGQGGEGFDHKYMMKAMTLTEDDVQSYKVDGNKYMIQIKKCVTPDENSALAHATNDYITFAQVNQSIADAVGSAVKVEESGSEAIYSKILFTATIVDGKMTNLEYSYTFSATLKLKIAVIPATGTGEAEIQGKYTDIKY